MLPSPLSLLSRPPSKGPLGQSWCGLGGFPRKCCLVNTRCSCFGDISWWSHWDDFWEAAVWKWRGACEFQLSFKIKILLFVIWREVENMFLPRSSKLFSQVFREALWFFSSRCFSSAMSFHRHSSLKSCFLSHCASLLPCSPFHIFIKFVSN